MSAIQFIACESVTGETEVKLNLAMVGRVLKYKNGRVMAELIDSHKELGKDVVLKEGE